MNYRRDDATKPTIKLAIWSRSVGKMTSSVVAGSGAKTIATDVPGGIRYSALVTTKHLTYEKTQWDDVTCWATPIATMIPVVGRLLSRGHESDDELNDSCRQHRLLQ